jgi:hypothetical protein
VVSRAEKEFGKEQPVSKGELYALNADTTDQDLLFGLIPDYNGKRGRRKDNGFAYIAKVLPDEPGYALVSYYSYEQRDEPDSVVFR